MKKNLIILAITFSVALNLVFIGSFLYHGSGPISQARLEGRGNNHPLYEELDLTKDQLERFQPLHDSFHAFVKEQGRKIKEKQLELVGLLAMDQPDRLAIEGKKEGIRFLQGQMQAKVIDHLLEESKVFTPEQRKKFFALILGRIRESSGPRPRWMPQTQRKTSQGKGK